MDRLSKDIICYNNIDRRRIKTGYSLNSFIEALAGA